VVKLNTLANAVWTGAKYDNLLAVGWLRLVLILERRIVVRRLRREFGGTGVHHFKHPTNAKLDAARIHLIFAYVAQQPSDLQIGISLLLQGDKEFFRNIVQLVSAKFRLQLHQLLDLYQ